MALQKACMAPPFDFRVADEYSDNLAMKKERQPDFSIAAAQWQALRHALVSRGVEVEIAPRAEGLADYVFYANAGLPLPWENAFIVSNFLQAPRRPESRHIKEFFKHSRVIFELEPEEKFEGQGDAFFWGEDHEVLFIGYGIRTNLVGAKAVKAIVQQLNPKCRVEFLEMRYAVIAGERGLISFYHRDMCLMPLRSRGKFLIYPESFTLRALSCLKRYGELIIASPQQAYNFMLNGLEISEKSIIIPWADLFGRVPFGCVLFGELGYKDICIVPTTQYHLSGGGPKCLVLEL